MPFDDPSSISDEEVRLIERWILDGAANSNGSGLTFPVGKRVRLHGTLTDQWVLDGYPLIVPSSTRVDKSPQIGSYVRVRGRLGRDKRLVITRITRK